LKHSLDNCQVTVLGSRSDRVVCNSRINAFVKPLNDRNVARLCRAEKAFLEIVLIVLGLIGLKRCAHRQPIWSKL
jgi:hypothetical protein